MLEPKRIKNLLAGGWDELTFVPFREGISVCHLLEGAPAIAVLRYEPGAQVPLHEHTGVETIIMLEGSQSDEHGTYVESDVVINAAGSRHSIHSEQGCVVLLHWAQPVRFIDN